jgi:hypothetical protein
MHHIILNETPIIDYLSSFNKVANIKNAPTETIVGHACRYRGNKDIHT